MAMNYKPEVSRYRRYYKALESMTQKPEHRAYTTAIFSFLAISLFGWYAIMPTLKTILFLRREIADNIKVNQQMEDKITNLIQAQAAYQSLEPQLPSMTQALPETSDMAGIIAQLKNLAALSQASISAIQVASIPLASEPKTAPTGTGTTNSGKILEALLTVSLTAPYETLGTFLRGMMNMRRIITIDSLSITPEKNQGEIGKADTHTLRLIVKIKTYYYGQ